MLARVSITGRNELNFGIFQVHGLLIAPFFDKLSVVAMQAVMMAHICFPRHDHDQVTSVSSIFISRHSILHLLA